ncbi:MAG: exonuclease SbcCD subunit D [Oscillospiraceae bacterium]|nr:exonuclease SbcCD subunit D [Oscillospiraceae bacterium]
MKLIHLSDLHLGKRVNEFSMLDDQRFILDRILAVIDGEEPDAVLIAGDVYDKSVPSAEAVELFDDFLVRLAARRFRGRPLQTFVLSGNHDSPERLAFGGRLMDASGVHLAPVYGGRVEPFALTDEFGEVRFYMLPFVKPVHVRRFFPESGVESYTDALSAAVRAMKLDGSVRSVLMAHQFVTGAERSESEEISVGGLDNVDASVFEGFDYVALGHIHGPQNIGSERVRYCGSPLKYSFSEAAQEKSVTVVELGGKGSLRIRTVPLKPKRDLTELRGRYEELMRRSFYEGKPWQEDYVHITLTDEDDVPEAMARLRTVYRNLMKLDYDNARTRHTAQIDAAAETDRKSPLELFGEFYEKQNGEKPNDAQLALLSGLIEEIWEEA